MRSIEERNQILELHAQGKNNCQISRILNIPRCTIRDIIKNRHSEKATRMPEKFIPENFSEEQRAAYAYILGQYLGDGCIDLGPRNVYRMRIASDCKYPNIIKEIKDKMQTILPSNKPLSNVVMNNGNPSCDHVTIYSKKLKDMFPQHALGKKHDREIKLTDWQQSIVNSYSREFIRGLIHSDGCRFFVTKANQYWYQFTNVSLDILYIYKETLDKLNVSHRTTKRKITGKMKHHSYNVITTRKNDVQILDSFIGPKT